MKHISIIAILVTLMAFQCAKDYSIDPRAGSIARFTVLNGFMYTLNPNEILTYSMQNPDKPELVNRLETDYGLETILVIDNKIYVSSRASLYTLDITNPAAPVILSKTGQFWELFHGCYPVVVKDHFAFSTVKTGTNACGYESIESALQVSDVTDPTAPKFLGSYNMGTPDGLAYQGNYLFVCDEGADKIAAYDISDPSALKQLPDAGAIVVDPYDLIIDGLKMIVSTKTDFEIFDLSQAPVLKHIGTISK